MHLRLCVLWVLVQVDLLVPFCGHWTPGALERRVASWYWFHVWIRFSSLRDRGWWKEVFILGWCHTGYNKTHRNPWSLTLWGRTWETDWRERKAADEQWEITSAKWDERRKREELEARVGRAALAAREMMPR